MFQQAKQLKHSTKVFSVKPDLETSRNIWERKEGGIADLFPRFHYRRLNLMLETVKELRWLAVLTTVSAGSSRKT